MVLNRAKIDVRCPICDSIEVSKSGKSKTGKQRYSCNNKHCKTKTFQLEYNYNACQSHIDEQMINMTANSSGTRDISRVLKISTYKVMSTLKKQKRQSYRFGKGKDAVFEEFRKILEGFGITKFYSDNWRSYSKYWN